MCVSPEKLLFRAFRFNHRVETINPVMSFIQLVLSQPNYIFSEGAE